DVLGASSLSAYHNDPLVSLTIMALIILGGLGFSVWIELFECAADLKRKIIPANLIIRRLSLHTKLVLIITTVLIISGGIFFFIAEYTNPDTIGNFSISEKLLASFFQSVTLRTAGFFTIDQYTLTPSSKLISVVLMTIGGSPGGAAGGMKTTTLGVIIVSMINIVRGNERIFIFHRRISFNTLLRSLVIVMLIISLLLSGCIILSFTEIHLLGRFEFLDLLYEVTSALSTTGLSVGISPLLTTTGKLVLSALMFIGRLGPFTIALALTRKVNKNNNSMNYPEGKVLVG
ncbi:MAG: Trk family potassium uptake protein, partial [Firmicutes bacterium]|nr:Trk family potassium uptake protein [Bacillota bacterium]